MKINLNLFKLLNNVCIHLLLLGLLLFPIRSFSQTRAVSIWAAPSEQKIRPNDTVEKNNLIWMESRKEINIFGGSNEHIAFQIVITTPVPEGRKPKAPGGFFMTVSDLTSSQGKIIPKERIKLFLEHYILLYGKSSIVGSTGLWPDALAPLKVPFDMQAQYEVVGNRPVWVDVDIPTGTPAGKYKGIINVTRNGVSLEHLNLELKVYGFSLPNKTHLITYMNISKESLAQFYHKPDSSKDIDRLTQTYYKFLYDHRMEPWFNDQLQPNIIVHNREVIVKFNEKRYKYYMDSLNTNRVLLNSYPSELKAETATKPFSPEFKEIVGSYLSQVTAYFKRHGWGDRLVFNSPIDEPDSKADYDNTRSWAELVHHAAPGIPFLATKTPVTPEDHLNWGTLRGYVNDFSIHGNALNDHEVKKAILEEESKGGEITWYISCDQHYPQPNYFIDAPALDPVMIPWITARYHLNGILYWALNYWPETVNPWLDAVTFHSGFLCSDGYVLNGEGSLLYPGDFTREYAGQPNVYGPVSSIRLELLREGIQDYEHLWMLRNSGEGKYADSIVRSLVVSVKAFSRNREDIYLARKAMAERLEEIAKHK
jgi:hypothetical protein